MLSTSLLKFRQLVRRHGMYFGFLILTIVIWLFIKMSEQFYVNQQFDIDYLLDDHYVFTEIPANTISTQLQAKGWDLFNLHIGRLGKKLQLKVQPETDKQTINHTELIRAIKMQFLGDRIKVLQISPEHIPLKYELLAQKKVPVLLNGKLSPAKGYTFKKPIGFDPDSVLLKGQLQSLNGIDFWPTTPINLEGLKDSITIEIDLQPIQAEDIIVLQEKVRLTAAIEQKTRKTLTAAIHYDTSKMHIIPKIVELSFEVGLSRYDSIRASDFVFEIQLDSTTSEENLIAPVVLVKKPQEIEQVNYQPKVAKYILWSEHLGQDE